MKLIFKLTEKQLEHLFKAEKELKKAGVRFDTGFNLEKDERVWELDYSLKGARIN